MLNDDDINENNVYILMHGFLFSRFSRHNNKELSSTAERPHTVDRKQHASDQALINQYFSARSSKDVENNETSDV